jgi:cytochrome c peroxidase
VRDLPRPVAGFTGGTSIFNATTVAQPAVPSSRNSYAAFAPIFHYNATVADFYGGNFWDSVVWKASQGGYASLVQLIGGAQSFAITWPANVASVCATPGPPPASDPLPVHLIATDRGTSTATYDHLTLAMASYEASAEVSPFSSKFDAFI